jgi:serine/threonine-protein kinase
MTGCLDDEAIANLSAGVLDENERAALTAHLDVCAACRTLVAEVAPAGAPAPDVEEAARSAGAAPKSLIGATLDRKYEILGLLGEGGMGSVYLARHVGTSRRVAVKLIRPDKIAAGGAAESRFRREARAAAAIRSPHIVEILDAGTDDGTGLLYLVMERLSGEDLQHLLDRVGALPYEVALRVAGQALAGLAKAHDAGIVHRDIKPANLFLAREDDGAITVKVLDFGVAKVRADPLRALDTMSLTDTGGFVGSPLYMSPEQVQSSKDVDARADVWSLGSVLYAAVAGRAPHEGIASLGKLVVTICGIPAPPLCDLAPGVPEEVAAVVHRALAIDPAERWSSASTMLEAIGALSLGGVVLREEMFSQRAAEAHADAVSHSRVRPELDLRRKTSRPAPASTARRSALLLVPLLALGIGAVLGYRLTRPGATPPFAGSASANAPPASVSSEAASAVDGDASQALREAPLASGVRPVEVVRPEPATSTQPTTARRPAAARPVAVRPTAEIVPPAPPKRTADPLIPAEPP